MKRIFPFLVVFFVTRISVAAPPATQPTRFLRYVESADGSARLESAEATYKNDKGVVVHLIGAVHIADPEYYAGLNESFDHYDALLYELVKPRDAEPSTQPSREPSLKWVANLQRFLRDHLDLTFQLDEIDYDRPNFVHADLDMESFTEMQADRGESMLTLMLRSAMANMKKSAGKGSDVSGLELLGALFSPDQSRELKRVLAQEFGDLDDAMDAMEGPNGSVIVGERNKVALRVLREQMQQGKKFIGIFYGAGHLKLMEKSLEKMGFHKVGVTWRTAWDIPAPAASPSTRPSNRP